MGVTTNCASHGWHSPAVTLIEECGAIARGDGSVVTGRFTTSRVDAIARLTVRNEFGLSESVEGTLIHPIWSVDRNDWVSISDLDPGERLQGSEGILYVESIDLVRRNVSVYNIEVHGEHVYQVGELGLLVHNTCPTTPVSGLGNIGSHLPIASGDALNHGIKWLGAGYNEIAPGVFRSADGLRQFRMTAADLLGSHGKVGPHVHIEALDKFGKVIENLHLPIF
jgi:hypothetical protein